MAQVQVLKGDRLVQGFALADRPLTLGRGHEADVRIADRSLARRHCRLAIEDGRVVVTDLETGSGVYHRGERVPCARIEPGEEVAIGDVRIALLAGQVVGSGSAAARAAALAGEAGASAGPAIGEDTTCYLEAVEAGAGPALHVDSPRGLKDFAARLERLVADLGQLYDELERATSRDRRLAPLVQRLRIVTIEAEALLAD